MGHEKREPVVNGDGDGNFEPKQIPKHQIRWSGFGDRILSLYARGMKVP